MMVNIQMMVMMMAMVMVVVAVMMKMMKMMKKMMMITIVRFCFEQLCCSNSHSLGGVCAKSQ